MRSVSKKSPSKLGDERNRCVPDTIRFFTALLSAGSGFPLLDHKSMRERIAVVDEDGVQSGHPRPTADRGDDDSSGSVGRPAILAQDMPLGAIKGRVEYAD